MEKYVFIGNCKTENIDTVKNKEQFCGLNILFKDDAKDVYGKSLGGKYTAIYLSKSDAIEYERRMAIILKRIRRM